jgi:glycosyltransferase involved in cell wall biosynthesis
VAWDISQLMRDRGHNVTIFCCKQKPADPETSRYEGVHIVRLELPKTSYLDPFKIRKQINAGLKVANRCLVGISWDLIHIHLPIQGNIIYQAIGPNSRFVYTVHSPSVLEQKIKWMTDGLKGRIKWLFGKGQLKRLEGGLLKKVDKIHTLSQFTKDVIDNFYGVGNKVTVIPHWCRQDFVRQHDKAESRKTLGWPIHAKILFTVRRLSVRMGLDIAINAIAPLLKIYPDAIFVIAGAGPLEKHLKQLAASFGMPDKIIFIGRVSDEQLRYCYEATDLFILPTLALECFGLPVLEAWGYGLPVISTDAAAIPELMRPVLPQCIVPAGDISKLRDTISAYLSGSLQLPSSKDLVDYTNTHYEWKVITPRMAEFLES